MIKISKKGNKSYRYKIYILVSSLVSFCQAPFIALHLLPMRLFLLKKKKSRLKKKMVLQQKEYRKVR